MNKKALHQNDWSHMCKYHLQQPKHKHKDYMTKYSVLHVYIPYTTNKHKHKGSIPKLLFIHV